MSTRPPFTHFDPVVAAQRLIEESSADQGLPQSIDDPAVIGKIARILIDARADSKQDERRAAA